MAQTNVLQLPSPTLPSVVASESYRELTGRIDELRVTMESELEDVRLRCKTYLNWYSPPFQPRLGTHDAWTEPFLARDVGLTRANFPIARACVDIWTALESAKPAVLWAQPERVAPVPPSLDQAEQQRNMLVASAFKKYQATKSTIRAQRIRDWQRRDDRPLKRYVATRRKNLYGFSWTKIWPHPAEKRPVSHVLRNPTTVFPVWSDADPTELEAVLVAYQVNANRANNTFGLGIEKGRRGELIVANDSGVYRPLDERWYDRQRHMLWVEEYWWREQEFDRHGFVMSSVVKCVTRCADRLVKYREYEGWRLLPWIYDENTDERDSFGWSDIAGVIDINDEFNRRLSQEGDIIGSYSAPRFQLLNSFTGRNVEMPGPFELISLQDQEKIEQILTRIDVFPTQQHFQILTDLLHRVTGLPPIVWGLIANAQTSGRALSASWKATEARLAPKLMRDEQSHDAELALELQYARVYDWKHSRELYTDDDGEPFMDFRWEFPPMEPRDFMEVTQNEITKRDAGVTTTLKAIRAIGDEAAEDTFEEVQAESLDIFTHPDKVQAFLLAQRAELDNIAFAQELGVQIDPGGGKTVGGGAINPATVAEAVGMARSGATAAATPVPGGAGPLPATQPGAPANAGGPPPTAPGEVAAGSGGAAPGETLTSGTLMRQGNVSNQFLQTRRY